MAITPKISPFLWFDGRAKEAAIFYVSVFGNARLLSVADISTGPARGGALVEFELEGQRFAAVDGGPQFSFSPAISFVVTCDTQTEVDYYWERLAEGGAPGQCGWLADKFGLSWQIVPAMLPALVAKAPEKVMNALLAMTKIDIEGLRQAAES